MGWRILYIEKSDYLNSYLDNLKVKNGNNETTIPFSDIDSIVIDNHYMNMSVGFINKCVEYKINLVICDYYHLPSSLLLPYSGNYQSSLMLQKQLKWTEEQKGILWKAIVEAKLKNQRKVLIISKKDDYSIDLLEKYINEVEIYDETNREGLGAKVYFRALFGNDFIRQNEDSINSSLNYGYSILRSQICRSLIARGLNAHLGIFHKGPNNTFNLADDIIEVFRPIIDLWVYKNVNYETLFNNEIRMSLVELTTKKISYGNMITITNAINILIDKIINFFETGNMEYLTFPDVIYHE